MPLDQSRLSKPAAARGAAGALVDKQTRHTLAKVGVLVALGGLVRTGPAWRGRGAANGSTPAADTPAARHPTPLRENRKVAT
jgi:hypothetical protein